MKCNHTVKTPFDLQSTEIVLGMRVLFHDMSEDQVDNHERYIRGSELHAKIAFTTPGQFYPLPPEGPSRMAHIRDTLVANGLIRSMDMA